MDRKQQLILEASLRVQIAHRGKIESALKKMNNDDADMAAFLINQNDMKELNKFLKTADKKVKALVDSMMDKTMKEELDELNTSTLRSYNAKASDEAGELRRTKDRTPEQDKKRNNRIKGQQRAMNKMINRRMDAKYGTQKEEVELDEASWTAAASGYAATRKRDPQSQDPKHDFRVGHSVITRKGGKSGEVVFVDGEKIHVKGTNIYYPDRVTHHTASDLKKGVAEAVELDEAKYNYLVYSKDGELYGAAETLGKAKSMNLGSCGKIKTLKNPMSQKAFDKMVDKTTQEAVELGEANYAPGMYDLSKNNTRKLQKTYNKMKDSKMSDKDKAVFAALKKELEDRGALKEEVELGEAYKVPKNYAAMMVKKKRATMKNKLSPAQEKEIDVADDSENEINAKDFKKLRQMKKNKD